MAATVETCALPWVTRRLSGKVDLPALAARHPARYPCLLESVTSGTPSSRWDVLLALPQSTLCLGADGRLLLDGVELADNRFLPQLDAAWRRERVFDNADDELPFHGGWALWLGYELAGQLESRLRLPACGEAMPLAMAVRCPAAVLYDHREDCTWLIAEREAAANLDVLAADVAQAGPVMTALPALLDLVEDDPARFLDGVARIHDHLAAGDVFQVNLSRAWQARFEHAPTPAALYAALRRANPAPFAALWQQPDWAVASSSPERLVQSRAGQVQTRPIAGTRPRLPGDDDALRRSELLGHLKERAEHVMLVDLERNDLGRVCRPGSVRVSELMTLETYVHVHHIVSNVCGCLRADVTPGELIVAVFPGGTITGCPKIRCMEIIAELEGEGRGGYTGAIGYLDRNGDMDLNILIRTLTQTARGVRFRAGAGIVVDSIAERELAETRAKARGMARALGADA
ncbi:MAG TPA: aminodeoxychorismate synthase component I [Rhodanobacteraceae bacterium]